MRILFNIVDYFEIKAGSGKTFLAAISILGVMIILAISCLFLFQAIEGARAKDFWMDEDFGLKGSVRNASFWSLIVSGARGQASSAPLDYLLLKLYDRARSSFSLDWIPFNIYFRLNSILCNLISGLLVLMLFWNSVCRKAQNYLILLTQMFCLVTALVFYYFWPYNMHFSIETRPYALWNSLWFSLLALFLLYREFRWKIFVLAVLLSLSSAGAFFQLGSLAFVLFLFNFREKKNLFRAIKDVSLKLGIPLLIAVYYILKSDSMGNMESDSYYKEFINFWTHKEMIPILSGVGILLTVFWKRWQAHTVVFSTMLLLYVFSPVINHLVLAKHFFFSSRQYLYYDLIYPFFFLSVCLLLPDYWGGLKKDIR